MADQVKTSDLLKNVSETAPVKRTRKVQEYANAKEHYVQTASNRVARILDTIASLESVAKNRVADPEAKTLYYWTLGSWTSTDLRKNGMPVGAIPAIRVALDNLEALVRRIDSNPTAKVVSKTSFGIEL